MKSQIIDAVIEEIHQTRSEISMRFGGDLVAIAEDAAHRQSVSKRKLWKPKIPEPANVKEHLLSEHV